MQKQSEEEIVTSIRVNKELWQQAKIHAIKRRMKLHELIEQLLKEEIEAKKVE